MKDYLRLFHEFGNVPTLSTAFRTRAPTQSVKFREPRFSRQQVETLELRRSSTVDYFRARDTQFFSNRGKPFVSYRAGRQRPRRSKILEHLWIAVHNISDAAGDRDLPPSPEEGTRVTLTSHSPASPFEPSDHPANTS